MPVWPPGGIVPWGYDRDCNRRAKQATLQVPDYLADFLVNGAQNRGKIYRPVKATGQSAAAGTIVQRLADRRREAIAQFPMMVTVMTSE